jgi:hypothetical protein
MKYHLSSYAVNSPAIADTENTVATIYVTDGIMILETTKTDPIQKLRHHSQVDK